MLFMRAEAISSWRKVLPFAIGWQRACALNMVDVLSVVQYSAVVVRVSDRPPRHTCTQQHNQQYKEVKTVFPTLGNENSIIHVAALCGL